MDMSILLEYGWVFIVLVGLEGILAVDNAVVMAVLVKHLPEEKQKKALFYGLLGAFVFRFGALFLLSMLVNVWQIQAVGALYLIYLSVDHLVKRKLKDKHVVDGEKKGSSFWVTVLKVELADLAFAIDSMLVAVAFAVALPELGSFTIGGLNAGQFFVMFLAGLAGIVLIRFAASRFMSLLKKYPTLESVAFVVVGWVGVKLAVITLSHEKVGLLHEHFPESALWKSIFWTVLGIIVLTGYFIAKKAEKAKTSLGE